MVGKAERMAARERPEDESEHEWEAFVRDDRERAMRHVGSVTAPDAETAHGRVTKLFAWFYSAVWICPPPRSSGSLPEPLEVAAGRALRDVRLRGDSVGRPRLRERHRDTLHAVERQGVLRPVAGHTRTSEL